MPDALTCTDKLTKLKMKKHSLPFCHLKRNKSHFQYFSFYTTRRYPTAFNIECVLLSHKIRKQSYTSSNSKVI